MRDIIVGTAGHIDHGKTTLVKALTGIDADRLAEEKRRGITIDLGFAHLELDDLRVGFIDVPGHERFVKNMLAGIGGIDFVLLVIAADESVMPQTREHFDICRLLEIPRGLVVLTKASLADEELLELTKGDVRSLVEGSFLETAPVVAVDSLSGMGMDNLKDILTRELGAVAGRKEGLADSRTFRLPVDRVFSMKGFGTVVTGTPLGGHINREEQLAVYPSGKTGKIRGMEVFGQKEAQAKAGQRAAINLTGLERDDLARGMVLAPPGSLLPSTVLDVRLSLLSQAPAPLRQRTPIRFHFGSGEFVGRIKLLEGQVLQPGESAIAQIRLDERVACCPFDHFIIRRYSPITTIGGGIVLDAVPPRHSRKTISKILPELRMLAGLWGQRNPECETQLVEYIVRSRGVAGLALPELIQRTGFTQTRLTQLVDSLPTVVWTSRERLQMAYLPALEDLERKVLAFIEEHHRQDPLSPGVSQEEVKRRFFARASSHFPFVLSRLQEIQKVELQSGTLSQAGRTTKLDTGQAEIRESLLSHYALTDLRMPNLRELQKVMGNTSEIGKVYYYLLQQGVLIKVSEELTISAEQLENVIQQLRRRFPSGSAFSVSDFKDLFGLSRKYAIPLLELLDRRKVTRRAGEARIML